MYPSRRRPSDDGTGNGFAEPSVGTLFLTLALLTLAVPATPIPATAASPAESPDAAAASPASPPVAPSQRPAATPAIGGSGILAATEQGAALGSGVLKNVRPLDARSYAADLRLGEVLRGSLKAGVTVTIAWEELSPNRPVRFKDGQKILVCLEPLPTASIWRTRLPDPTARRNTLSVANGGAAFLVEPDAATGVALRHYFAGGAHGEVPDAALPHLVHLVRIAPLGVANEALGKLAGADDLGRRLGLELAAKLARIAAITERNEALRRSVLRLLAEAKIEDSRPVLIALAASEDPLAPLAWRTLAQFEGGLSPEQVSGLLASDRGELRAVGANFLTGADSEEKLGALIDADTDPLVQIAAAENLVANHGVKGLDRTLPLLGSQDDAVRAKVATAIGQLGASVVPTLAKVAQRGSARQATGAVMALTFTGKTGRPVLREISDHHEVDQVRDAAKLAFGKLAAHEH